MIEIVEKMAGIVKTLPYNLRAELVIANLIEHGIAQDDIVISSKSLFRRTFSRDIENISVTDVNDRQQYVVAEVNREGMYDALPQALTHSARTYKKGIKSAEEMIAEVKERHKEEDAARKFFLPFENELHHQCVNLELEERSIINGFLCNSRYTDLWSEFWQLPAILNDRQKAILIYLVPVIYKAAGNLRLVKLCYEAILEIPINIICKNGFRKNVTNSFSCGDDYLRLGVNFVCGDNFYNHAPYLEIVCGPLNNTLLQDYLPEGSGRDVISFLNSYFLPFDSEARIEILTGGDKGEYILDSDALRLGYTSYL